MATIPSVETAPAITTQPGTVKPSHPAPPPPHRP
jgi:hypothetical protein